METFVFVLDNETIKDKKKMDEFNDLMAKIQDETVAYISKLAVELDISEGCAADVYYLRSRKRWTQELEDELIRLYRVGTPVNVMDFGVL